MKITLILIAVFSVFIADSNAQPAEWRPVNGSRQSNISGMALIERTNLQTTFIVVHDNKKKDQSHAGIITVEGKNAPKYTPLEWIGKEIPVDIEAVSAIPEMPNNFMALTADGHIFRFRVNQTQKKAEFIKTFDVPEIPPDADFEGFSLQKFGDTILAVWAERGLDEKDATLFWSKLNLQTDKFSVDVGKEKVSVPRSAEKTRHISDVKVDLSGGVFISSASDPGNDGPFTSAVYYLGNFTFGDKITFTKVPKLTRLFYSSYHKIEALELVSGADGGLVFGTDDENLGAAIYLNY